MSNIRLQNNRIREVSRSAGKVEFEVRVESGVTQEDVLKPEFYELVSNKFEPAGFMPEIRIIPDDSSWYMKVVVVSFGKTHAVVKKLFSADLDVDIDTDLVEKSGYDIKFRGAAKWCIMSPEGAVVKDGMQKTEAVRELEEYLKIIGK